MFTSFENEKQNGFEIELKHQNVSPFLTDVDEVAGFKRGAKIVDRSSSLASEGVGVCWAWQAKLRALKLNW